MQKPGLQRAAQMTELFREQMEALLSLNKQPDEEAAECMKKVKSFLLWHKGVTTAEEKLPLKGTKPRSLPDTVKVCALIRCVLFFFPPPLFDRLELWGSRTSVSNNRPHLAGSLAWMGTVQIIQMIYVCEGGRGTRGTKVEMWREETLWSPAGLWCLMIIQSCVTGEGIKQEESKKPWRRFRGKEFRKWLGVSYSVRTAKYHEVRSLFHIKADRFSLRLDWGSFPEVVKKDNMDDLTEESSWRLQLLQSPRY